MTWTYDLTFSQPRDTVRYLSGDVDVNNPLAQDEEINQAISRNPSLEMAAAEIAEVIAARCGAWVTTRVGDTQVNWSDLAGQFAARACQLRATTSRRGALVYAGGISLADKATHRSNTDAFPPAFTRTGTDPVWQDQQEERL